MSGEGAFDIVGVSIGLLGFEAGKTHDDSGRAEPALAGTGRAEGIGPACSVGLVEAFEGGDSATPRPADRGHAGDSGLAVDEHRAASALSLRAAPVLGGTLAQVIAERAEQCRPVVGNLDLFAVDFEFDHGVCVNHGRRLLTSGRRDAKRDRHVAGLARKNGWAEARDQLKD